MLFRSMALPRSVPRFAFFKSGLKSHSFANFIFHPCARKRPRRSPLPFKNPDRLPPPTVTGYRPGLTQGRCSLAESTFDFRYSKAPDMSDIVRTICPRDGVVTGYRPGLTQGRRSLAESQIDCARHGYGAVATSLFSALESRPPPATLSSTTICRRRPIHRITGTAIEFPKALYLWPSAAGLPR